MRKYLILTLFLVIAASKYSSFNPSGPLNQFRPFIDHPLQKGSLINENLKAPFPTCQWYQNFLIGDGSLPVSVLPLAFAVSNGLIKISTSDPNRNIRQSNYVASVFVADWTFNHGTSIKVSGYDELSVTFNGESKIKINILDINIPMVQGMPFFTAELNRLSPTFQTGAAILSVVDSNGKYSPGQKTSNSQVFTIQLNSGQYWVLYTSVPAIVIVGGNTLSFSAPIVGYVRIGCLGFSDLTNAVRPYLAAYPLSSTIDYSFTNDKYTLTFNYQTKGTGELIMMALPHHLETLQSPYKLSWTLPSLKGDMTAIIGSSWIFKSDLVTMEWDAPRDIDSDKKALILTTLKQDINLEYPDPDNNDPYWFGLKIAKFARLALIADNLGQDQIATDIRTKIAQRLVPWLTGKNADTLQYDRTYGGIVSKWGTKDSGADYGQGYYNDHYYHYGYHLYAIAVVARKNLAFYNTYKSQILDLVQDIANPDSGDKFFTVARHKDWFAGHSWANGLFAMYDNRNQESTSEAYNAYYALYLLGLATSNTELKNYGNLLLSTEIQSCKKYYHMPEENAVYPSLFKANRMVGMLWSFKADHATWFGSQEIFVHGIQMLPFVPITELSMDAAFVAQQYPVLKKGEAVEEWRVFEFLNHAIIDKAAAWTEATNYGKWPGTHPGQTKTNALWWIATRPNNNSNLQKVTE